MPPAFTEYAHQIAGRSNIVKVFGDHIIKPTSLYEVNSYLKMTPLIADVAPDCCLVMSNGKLQALRPCGFCSDSVNIHVIIQVLNATDAEHFLVMRDVAHGMIKPRILDLKLGTRTHSDFISEEKKRSHIQKSFSTTSSTLGLRLCGAKFYENDGSGKVKISKTEGRTLSDTSFISQMSTFFTICGKQKSLVTKQLFRIKEALEATEAQRFFGSSLLVIVDDHLGHEFLEKTVKVKLIDFSSMARSEPGEPQYVGADRGAIFGVSNLINIISD
uniref:Kinase n=1 Tax=Caenorhabditis japonica TaxID=281687 RepID=A0A8R1DTQ1_CAEJA